MQRQEETEKLRGLWTDRLAWALTLLLLVATAAEMVIFVVIAIKPNVALNPFPPAISTPLAEPSPTPTVQERTPTATPTATPTPTQPAASTRPPVPSPTPLRVVVPTPTPVLTMSFSAEVAVGQSTLLPDCGRAVLAGTVADQAGEALVGYPVHVWGPGADVIVLSGSTPRYGDSGWEVALPEGEGETSIWYIQLHLYDIHRAHPPLSHIVQVLLTDRCPQAVVRFQEQPSR